MRDSRPRHLLTLLQINSTCSFGCKNSLEFLHPNTIKCLCFVWITVSDCRTQKKHRAARRWKQPPKKPFHHVSCDEILHEAALARGFSDRHFEQGEGSRDEVGSKVYAFVSCYPASPVFLCPLATTTMKIIP